VELAFKSWGEIKAFVAGTNIINAWKVRGLFIMALLVLAQ
jgi:hypothetical protein